MTDLTLDHVGIAVRDLDRAAAQFRRLGFALTERGYHTLPAGPDGVRPRVGTGNSCAMLQHGYVELIGVTDAASVHAARLKQVIDRREGLHIVAFGTADAAAAAAALQHSGIAATPPRWLERPIEAGGRTDLARFEIVDFPPDLVPEGHFFAIRHATPEYLWKPDLLRHPNTVLGLDRLIVAVPDPRDFAARLGRVLASKPSADPALTLARGRVEVVDEAWLQQNAPHGAPALPWIAGIGLGVADLATTERVLRQAGVPFDRRGDLLRVGPDQACGALLEFAAA